MLERDERGPRLARSDKQAEHSSHIFSSVLALRNCFSYCLELYQTWDERPFSWMQFKFQWQNTQNDHSHTKNGSVFDGMRGLIASMCMLDMNEYEIDWNSICMDQYGSVWISMDQYGSVWISMDQYGSVWISMDQYGSVWISMDQYGSVWISMDQYGSVWISMDQYGSVWISMDQYNTDIFYTIPTPMRRLHCPYRRICRWTPPSVGRRPKAWCNWHLTDVWRWRWG